MFHKNYQMPSEADKTNKVPTYLLESVSSIISIWQNCTHKARPQSAGLSDLRRLQGFVLEVSHVCTQQCPLLECGSAV